MQPEPIENVVVRSWRVFAANPIIMVPGIVIGLVVGVLGALFGPPPIDPAIGMTPALAARYITAALIFAAISVLAFVATIAYTTGMAAAAWRHGVTTFADGTAALRRDGRHIVMAIVGLIVVFFAASVLALPTIFLSILAAVVFCMYAMPATVVDDMPGFAAIALSARIAWRRFVPTLILAIVLVAVEIAVSLVAALFGIVPFAHPIIAGIVQQAVAAFATIVIVGEYMNLRSVESSRFAP
jgi:hypothetical protein